MHSHTTETDKVGFGRAMLELLVVAIAAFVFAFGVDWALTEALPSMGIHLKPAAAAPPGAPAPADD